ncbi:MAG: hypothetical protein WAR24_03070 [Candidatus Acidiferrales bacterium]
MSYTWVKKALQGAGLVSVARKRPLPGMLLHIDGSHHQWFPDDRWYDLLVSMDDATNRIYYAQLVEEESTLSVQQALRKVVEQEEVFCALYSDRASYFFWTPRAGGKVDPVGFCEILGTTPTCSARIKWMKKLSEIFGESFGLPTRP